MKRIVEIITLAAFILATQEVLAAAGPVFNPVYAARGALDQRILVRGRVISQRWSFELMEDSMGRWKLSYVTALSPEDQMTGEIIAYDGSSIYSVITGGWKLVISDGRPTIRPSGDTCAAKVTAGPYPVDYSSAVGTIWLAFIAGRLLPADRQVVPFPNLTVSDARLSPLAWSCDLSYALTVGDVRPLLERGRYRLNPRYVRASALAYPDLDDPDNASDFHAQRKEFENLKRIAGSGSSITVAEYVLGEKEPFHGFLIPTRFQCQIWPLKDLDRTLAPAIQMAGTVTNVFAPDPCSLLPPLASRADVLDRRFRVKTESGWREGLFYTITNRQWIVSTNDDRLQRLVAGRRLRPYADWDSRQTPYMNRVFLVVVGMALVMPILLLWLGRRGGQAMRPELKPNTRAK